VNVEELSHEKPGPLFKRASMYRPGCSRTFTDASLQHTSHRIVHVLHGLRYTVST
jgi:hypothetical protein